MKLAVFGQNLRKFESILKITENIFPKLFSPKQQIFWRFFCFLRGTFLDRPTKGRPPVKRFLFFIA